MTMQDKVAVVTGGGSGIGEATVKELARRGAAVVVGDVDEAGGARVVDEVRAENGRAVFVRVDVSTEESADELVQTAVDEFGGLQLAANIAGIGQPPSRVHDLDEATWDRVLGIDLRGTWLCMRSQIGHMLEHGGGSIVNMASIAGLKPTAQQPAYSVAKAGVIALTRQAALEYAKDDIRVNSVAPGVIATPLVAALPPETLAMYAAQQPVGRLGRPQDIAQTVAWLLSDEAAYVTGLTHVTDGGSLLT